MSLKPSVLKNVNLNLTLGSAIVSPLNDVQSPSIPVIFSGNTYVTQLQGTYSPANDQLVIATFPSGINPTWMLFVCDLQANVILEQSGGGQPFNMPITQLLFLTFTALSPIGAEVILDGRASGGNPMAQGTPVNWALYYGDGSPTP